MARLARLVIPGLPHHITQRGNRRQQTFFNDGDYAAYVELMAQWCGKENVEIWSYCLMPNHAHLIAVPTSEEGLRRAVGEAHRRYTRRISFREKWRGYLWQERLEAVAGRVLREAERRPAIKTTQAPKMNIVSGLPGLPGLEERVAMERRKADAGVVEGE